MDGGIDQKLAGDRVQLSATYFYTRLQDVIVFDSTGFITPATDPYGRFGGYRNTGGGLARGVELGMTAKPYRTLDVAASYTFTFTGRSKTFSTASISRADSARRARYSLEGWGGVFDSGSMI